ncbi:MAG TPA: NIPSNAP family protein [Caldilineaceae bacterium]|nr:NIPSNAP family protein [Caldilineaceae bacterium]
MTIVNRRTFTAKPGKMAELIDVLKAGGSYLENMPTFRVYQALFGQNNRAILELDFDDLAHYERFWAAWGAAPESAGIMERLVKCIEAEQTNKIWQLR